MRSMRPTRASSSSTRVCMGSTSGVVAQAPSSNAATAAVHTRSRSVDVDNLHPPVLGIGILVAACRGRALLAVADRGNLRILHALQRQRPLHGLRTLFTQADVVFARAALVRVAFEPHSQVGVSGQETAMRRNDIDVFAADLAAVEVEVDHALRAERTIRSQRPLGGGTGAGIHSG